MRFNLSRCLLHSGNGWTPGFRLMPMRLPSQWP